MHVAVQVGDTTGHTVLPRTREGVAAQRALPRVEPPSARFFVPTAEALGAGLVYPFKDGTLVRTTQDGQPPGALFEDLVELLNFEFTRTQFLVGPTWRHHTGDPMACVLAVGTETLTLFPGPEPRLLREFAQRSWSSGYHLVQVAELPTRFSCLGLVPYAIYMLLAAEDVMPSVCYLADRRAVGQPLALARVRVLTANSTRRRSSLRAAPLRMGPPSLSAVTTARGTCPSPAAARKWRWREATPGQPTPATARPSRAVLSRGAPRQSRQRRCLDRLSGSDAASSATQTCQSTSLCSLTLRKRSHGRWPLLRSGSLPPWQVWMG